MQDRRSAAEVKMFAALGRALSADWTVLHHVQWLQKRPGRDTPDGEADFVIVHPDKGALVLEIKGGRIRYEAASGQWFTSGTGPEGVKIHDPVGQARDSTYALHRFARSLPGWPQRWGRSHTPSASRTELSPELPCLTFNPKSCWTKGTSSPIVHLELALKLCWLGGHAIVQSRVAAVRKC